MRPIRFNTCNFCCIYLLNNKNLECRHTSIQRCYTQDSHISFRYFVEKVLIWKFFMLLVESPFAGWFFPFKRFIEKVLNWSVFKLLVFLFAGCLSLEVPSFSGQFERKIQNLEWGPLDLNELSHNLVVSLLRLFGDRCLVLKARAPPKWTWTRQSLPKKNQNNNLS